MFIEQGKTRRRLVPGPIFTLREERRIQPTDKWVTESKTSVSFDGIQITESDGNRWPPPKGGELQDHGSEFFSLKSECLTKKFGYAFLKPKWPNVWYSNEYRIIGNLIAGCLQTADTAGAWGACSPPYKPNFPPDLSSSRASLVSKGAIAVAAVNPGNPIANVATAVGELLQDVPDVPGIPLIKTRLKALGTVAAAGEFLNYQFGIAPTISDTQSFLKAVHAIDKVLDQFERDSGKNVRRKYVFPTERTESTTELQSPWAFSPATWYQLKVNGAPFSEIAPGSGAGLPAFRTIRKRVVERKTWFSGAFTYWLPRGYDSHDRQTRMKMTAKLLGAQPDLNTLWNLAPWSWAVDWFSNTGALVKNLQALISYGTVLRYGYIMEETSVTDTYSARPDAYVPEKYTGTFTKPWPAITPVVLRTTVKKRVKANPFGFGVAWEGLSPTQLAITAALGITRVVK